MSCNSSYSIFPSRVACVLHSSCLFHLLHSHCGPPFFDPLHYCRSRLHSFYTLQSFLLRWSPLCGNCLVVLVVSGSLPIVCRCRCNPPSLGFLPPRSCKVHRSCLCRFCHLWLYPMMVCGSLFIGASVLGLILPLWCHSPS